MSLSPSPIELLAAVESAEQAGQISKTAAANIRNWLTQPEYAEFLPLLIEHIVAAKWAELNDVFWTSIPFGTAGRRGRMFPIGTNAINDRTIGESAQGLADYISQYLNTLAPGESPGAKGAANSPPAAAVKRRCAISYDTRHRSRH